MWKLGMWTQRMGLWKLLFLRWPLPYGLPTSEWLCGYTTHSWFSFPSITWVLANSCSAKHTALICLKEAHWSKGKLPHVVQCLSTIPQQCHWEKGAFAGVRREPLLEVLGITPCPCWPASICVTPLSPSPSLRRDEVGSRGTGLEHLWDWFQCRLFRILASHLSAQSWAPLTVGTGAFPAASWDVLCGRRGGNQVFLTVVMSPSGRGGFPLAIRPGTSPFRFIGEYEKKM